MHTKVDWPATSDTAGMITSQRIKLEFSECVAIKLISLR